MRLQSILTPSILQSKGGRTRSRSSVLTRLVFTLVSFRGSTAICVSIVANPSLGEVTEPQSHSMVEVGRDLCGSPSPTPCRSRVTHSTGPCPGGAGISPEKETPQPLWAACSRALSPSEGSSSLQPRWQSVEGHPAPTSSRGKVINKRSVPTHSR